VGSLAVEIIGNKKLIDKTGVKNYIKELMDINSEPLCSTKENYYQNNLISLLNEESKKKNFNYSTMVQ
jgi:hypothetical protein